eukprot:1154161-Pelagomonas_calceolata.AAC.2
MDAKPACHAQNVSSRSHLPYLQTHLCRLSLSFLVALGEVDQAPGGVNSNLQGRCRSGEQSHEGCCASRHTSNMVCQIFRGGQVAEEHEAFQNECCVCMLKLRGRTFSCCLGPLILRACMPCARGAGLQELQH